MKLRKARMRGKSYHFGKASRRSLGPNFHKAYLFSSAKYSTIVKLNVLRNGYFTDEVTSTNESYEKTVVDHPERFSEDVVESAKARLAEYDLATPTDDR